MSEYLYIEKPFLDQLRSLGWTVIDQGCGIIPSDPQTSLRQSFRERLLPQVFRDSIHSLNPWLTEKQLDDLRDQILRQSNRTLLEANEEIQKLFFKAQVDVNETTGESDPVVTLIDFEHPENNTFHAINQFRIDTPGCVKKFIIPDIVLFVNGIPLVVVEAKIGDANTANPMHAAYEQLLRYRNGREETLKMGLREGEPKLFHTNMLLIRTCGEKAEFGSITSGHEHFYSWKHVWLERRRSYEKPFDVEREQELLIQGLLASNTLLDILRNCTVFMDTDEGTRIKVIARYQQYRAARRIIKRILEGKSATERSGVIWHTQGSGKSLTMVFVARMLRASKDLHDYKIIMVNDRIDLEEQLTATARMIGGKVNVIESTEDLRRDLATETSDVNMVMVHKFMERKEQIPRVIMEALPKYKIPPKASGFGIVNKSERIILMIDEAHRTQSSELGDNLFEAFPNATRIGFTGTPLITEQHGSRRTVKRFGEYIDTYKLMDAVSDGATLQILYEGRTADTALKDKQGFDRKFEDLFKKRTKKEIDAIKKKYGATGDILEAEQRIRAIAHDLVDHYIENILPDGFKAQVVCTSKLAAIRYQKAIREALKERAERERLLPKPNEELIRKIEFLKAVVVISSDSTNEAAYITEARKEARNWSAIENFCKPFDFEDPEKRLTGIAFLVVCDMLLTGFDAPVEQVMYIDKKLQEHNLLQAIARVNRVAKGKERGFIVDYIGLSNHLTYALSIYAKEDQQDVQAGLKNILTEVPVLEERYQRLLHHFRDHGINLIEEFVTGKLESAKDEILLIHKAVGAMKAIKRRADFEIYLKKFLQSLNLILPNPAGHPYRGPARRFGYLLQMVKERYKDDSLDLSDAGAKVKALINEHLVELGINPKIPPIELLAPDFLARVNKHAQGDAEAKASEMEHAIRKHCTIHFDEDPVFYRKLSDKLEKLIQIQKENWEALVKGYEELRKEAEDGRTEAALGLSKEQTTFYDYVSELAFGNTETITEEEQPQLKAMIIRIIELLQNTIDIIDFWNKPIEVKKLRGSIDTELILSDIPRIIDCHEQIAVEIVKLAQKRHEELVRK